MLPDGPHGQAGNVSKVSAIFRVSSPLGVSRSLETTHILNQDQELMIQHDLTGQRQSKPLRS